VDSLHDNKKKIINIIELKCKNQNTT
jgi:hypothetical protein